jgi:hypothetical protein
MESSVSPMHRPMDRAPRCTAHSKRSGQPCRAPAVRGHRVCRMHGAGGGAPTGEANGNYRHGRRTQEMTRTLRLCRALAQFAREIEP